VSLGAGVEEGGPLGAALEGIEWEFPVGVVEGEPEGPVLGLLVDKVSAGEVGGATLGHPLGAAEW